MRKKATEGGIGLAVSLIFHVGGWNNINISFSLKLNKSNSYYYSTQTTAAAHTPYIQ